MKTLALVEYFINDWLTDRFPDGFFHKKAARPADGSDALGHPSYFNRKSWLGDTNGMFP